MLTLMVCHGAFIVLTPIASLVLKNLIGKWAMKLNSLHEETRKPTDNIKGGLEDQESETQELDPKELDAGTEAEKLHTDDEKTAEKIAIQHLQKFPKYYSELGDGLTK